MPVSDGDIQLKSVKHYDSKSKQRPAKTSDDQPPAYSQYVGTDKTGEANLGYVSDGGSHDNLHPSQRTAQAVVGNDDVNVTVIEEPVTTSNGLRHRNVSVFLYLHI